MINIQDIIPFMKDGWVAMDKDISWWWFAEKPVVDKELKRWYPYTPDDDTAIEIPNCFRNIAPADDWTKSLIQVKGVK